MANSVTTRAYDASRSGATDQETILSATAVRTRGIVKLFGIPIPDDPRLEAQPLAVGGLRMADGIVHDVIFQASMGNCVYAFDARTGAQLWVTNVGHPITGTTQIDGHMTNVHWGILSTPVIDEAAGILYACAWISKDAIPDHGRHVLVALHLKDGTSARAPLDLEGVVFAPPGLPQQKFASAQRKQRAALTLLNGHVLIPFGTITESSSTARGWLIAVDVGNWKVAASWCSTVTGFGAGIWQSGAGPAVGADGGIFVVTGNGSFAPDKGDFGESIVKLWLRTNPPRFEVASWWAPWTDGTRVGGLLEADEAPLPTNMRKTSLLGHAQRMRLHIGNVPHLDTGDINTGADHADPMIATLIQHNLQALQGSPWGDQDLGSGGPVYATAANAVLVSGKDGILYTGNAAALGDTAGSALAPAQAAANYAKLRFPPILYTYFDPSMDPAPQTPVALNRLPGAATRHLHGTPLLWRSAVHGLMHFCGGENSPLRAWTLAADGSSNYQAGSNEIASAQSPRPPGGMPG
jgi:hypothetical protein